MIKFYSFLNLFLLIAGSSWSLFARPLNHNVGPNIQVQIIESVDKEVILDSGPDSYWFATVNDIHPEYFRDIKPEDWEVYKVPGLFRSGNQSEPKRIWAMKKFIISHQWSSSHLSIRLGAISDRDEAYLNGKLIGRTGDFDSKKPQGYDKIRIYPIPSNLIRLGEENTLLVKIGNYFPNEIGIRQDYTSIGPSVSLSRKFYREEYFKIILLMVYFTAGGYFLFLFVRRRKELENLYFAMFTFFLVGYQFLRTQLKYELSYEFYTLKKIEYLFLPFLVFLFYHFIREFFKIQYHFVMKIVDVLQMTVFLFFLFVPDVRILNKVNSNLLQPLWLIGIIFIVVSLFRKIKEKNRDSVYILIGMLVIVFAVLADIMSNRQLIVLPRLTGYAFIFFILNLATILANKFVRLNEEVEELNVSLEKKVDERTKELNLSLTKAQELKIQQDGDYFLTSLLISPLIKNQNSSPYVRTEYFMRQKKTFEFRNRSYEIGGDIVITANITLNYKDYSIFLNGDAMGKSIQGAGGALVMGVVFNAIITRSKLKAQKNKSPELWLKETFLDMQNIFESFDGSMFLSGILGLVDNSNGFVYYVNAEHPWPVLFRDGKAEFLDEQLYLRKIGTPDNFQSFSIKTFQMQPGDLLIIGSDGRDDIQLTVDAEGNRVINEDETLFLRCVEQGKGELNSIVNRIEEAGTLTDDLTLLRIEYAGASVQESEAGFSEDWNRCVANGKEFLNMGNSVKAIEEFEKAHSMIPACEEPLKYLSKLHYKNKNFIDASHFFEKYADVKPDSPEALLYASVSYKMCKEFSKAADLGERFYLRCPNHLKNLINLADIYKNMGIREKTLELIEKISVLDPDNDFAMQVTRLLEKNELGDFAAKGK